MAKQSVVGIDVEKQVASCSRASRQRFGSMAPAGWSDTDSDSDFEKENDSHVGNAKKRPSLSLSSESKWFKRAKQKEIEQLKKPNPPLNTKRNTNWAVKNLETWWEWHNNSLEEDDEVCPEIVITPKCSVELLDKWLPIYVMETRNKSGNPYPPKTIYSLLTGILRHMTTENPSYPNFLEKKPAFVNFHLDNVFKKLREEGVGADAKHTATITIEENLLWSKGILNTTTPRGLLRAVFFYNGKNFVLRGGQEHRNLQISQLSRLFCPDRYVYTEKSSKNCAGGLAQLRLEHKTVPIYSVPSAGERCHVRLLDLYLSKLSANAKEKDNFYCQPAVLSNMSSNYVPWYTSIPCGKNYLAKMVPEVFKEAGVEEKKTNHSLRAAGVSQLFEAGVDEKVIQSRSGHRRLESLRMYERVTPAQEQAVSNVLSSRYRTDYQTEVQQSNLPVCLDPGPGVLPPMYSSSWRYNPVFAPHISSAQASQPSVPGMQCSNCSINIYQGPVSQPQNSGPTWHGPDDYQCSEKDVETFCDF